MEAVCGTQSHALFLMQLITAKVLRCRRVRRKSEQRCEGPNLLDIIVACLFDEVAHQHVFDDASAQRADRLLAYRGAPVFR